MLNQIHSHKLWQKGYILVKWEKKIPKEEMYNNEQNNLTKMFEENIIEKLFLKWPHWEIKY